MHKYSKLLTFFDMNKYAKILFEFMFVKTFLIIALGWMFTSCFNQLDGLEKISWIEILIDLVLVIVMGFLLRKDLIEDLRSFKGGLKFVLTVGITTVLMWCCCLLCDYLISTTTAPMTSQNQQQIVLTLQSSFILVGLRVCIVGPVLEELLYRLTLIKVFKSPWWGLVISSLVFGWMHISGDYIHMITYTTLGFILGTVYLKSNNIFYPITIHMAHNLMTLIECI